jgi:hypothetical protein
MLAPQIGHNSPGNIAISKDTLAEASRWLADHPVIETESDAREAAKFSERVKVAYDEIEKERDSKVRPLNNEVRDINKEYAEAKAPLEAARAELKKRMTAFALVEEAKRIAAAEAARKLAEDAERRARDAEAREQSALEDASLGVIGVDVVGTTQEANSAYAQFRSAAHKAKIADKDSHVRIGSGIGRAATLRTKEILTLNDPMKAIAIMGVSEKTREAILSDARAYRKLKGELPEGVTSQVTREI